jgi:hypothetical protein
MSVVSLNPKNMSRNEIVVSLFEDARVVFYPRQKMLDIQGIGKSISYINIWECDNIYLFHIGRSSRDSTYYLISDCIIEFTYHYEILDVKLLRRQEVKVPGDLTLEPKLLNIITERGIINVVKYIENKQTSSVDNFIVKQSKIVGDFVTKHIGDYLMVEIIGCSPRCFSSNLSQDLKKYKHRYLPTMTRN